MSAVNQVASQETVEDCVESELSKKFIDYPHQCKALKLVARYNHVLEHAMGVLDQRTVQGQNDVLRDDVVKAESAFAQLHERYQKLRVTVDEMEKNEEILKRTMEESEADLISCQERCSRTITNAEVRVNEAESRCARIQHENEVQKRSYEAALRRADLDIDELKNALERKTAQFNELSNLCDDILAVRNGTGNATTVRGSRSTERTRRYEAL
ncbi:hypothetical protein ACOME3_009196 [Neoechinorhynchus agilis]